MIAPSEKHLEDWIVDNLSDFHNESNVWFNYVDRQVQLPSGRCDLLGWQDMVMPPNLFGLHICEIKKGEVNLETLAQLLRYIRDVNRIWDMALEGFYYPVQDKHDVLIIPSVTGSLVGHSVTDSVSIACQALEIPIAIYEYYPISDDYSFSWDETHIPPVERCIQTTSGTLKSVIRDIYAMNIEKFMTPEEQQEMEDKKMERWTPDIFRAVWGGSK